MINSMSKTTIVEKFQGFAIEHEHDGFAWDHGGYFDTIEECRDDIADWNTCDDLDGRHVHGHPGDAYYDTMAERLADMRHFHMTEMGDD
jgi:hypothetical protein